MNQETQDKLIALAQRGAKCEAWAEWRVTRSTVAAGMASAYKSVSTKILTDEAAWTKNK